MTMRLGSPLRGGELDNFNERGRSGNGCDTSTDAEVEESVMRRMSWVTYLQPANPNLVRIGLIRGRSSSIGF
jgi:hypothetical protein